MGQALVPEFYQACGTQSWWHFPGQQVRKMLEHHSCQCKAIFISDTKSSIQRPLKSTERFPSLESLKNPFLAQINPFIYKAFLFQLYFQFLCCQSLFHSRWAVIICKPQFEPQLLSVLGYIYNLNWKKSCNTTSQIVPAAYEWKLNQHPSGFLLSDFKLHAIRSFSFSEQPEKHFFNSLHCYLFKITECQPAVVFSVQISQFL